MGWKWKWTFWKTIKACLYRHIKAFTDPPHNQKVVVGSIILLISLPFPTGYWVYHYLANNTYKWNAVLLLFKILSLSISRFETRTRFLLSKSQSSRRERDFCSLNLRVWDENEIFVLYISKFETRTRFLSEHLRVRDESEIFSFKVSRSSEKKWI